MASKNIKDLQGFLTKLMAKHIKKVAHEFYLGTNPIGHGFQAFLYQVSLGYVGYTWGFVPKLSPPRVPSMALMMA